MRTTPTQERAQKKVEAIRDAAIRLVEEVGRDRLNTGDVAKRAGVSIGTLYRYYPDRVALLDDILPNRDSYEGALRQVLETLNSMELSVGEQVDEIRETLAACGIE